MFSASCFMMFSRMRDSESVVAIAKYGPRIRETMANDFPQHMRKWLPQRKLLCFHQRKHSRWRKKLASSVSILVRESQLMRAFFWVSALILRFLQCRFHAALLQCNGKCQLLIQVWTSFGYAERSTYIWIRNWTMAGSYFWTNDAARQGVRHVVG